MDKTVPVLQPMAETALRSMKDIVLPSVITWWPHAWGWAVVAALVAAVIIIWFFIALKRYRRNAYRREALSKLEGIEQRLRSHLTRQVAIYDISLLLKKVAISTWGRDTVARLSGEEWARFLAAHDDADNGYLIGKVVDDFEYRDSSVLKRLPDNIADELAANTRRWIENHHV